MFSNVVISFSRSVRSCPCFYSYAFRMSNIGCGPKYINRSLPRSVPSMARYYGLKVGEDRELIVSESVEAALKSQDKIPDDYQIIYRAPLEKYIKITYATTAVAIATVPSISISIYVSSSGAIEYPVEFGGFPLFNTPMDAYLMTLMLVMTILNVAHTVSKYPFRIYRQPQENRYIAVFQHLIPFLGSKREFKAGEVKQSNGILWKKSLFRIKNKSVILLPDHFTAPSELERMMVEPRKNVTVEAKKRRSRMV